MGTSRVADVALLLSFRAFRVAGVEIDQGKCVEAPS